MQTKEIRVYYVLVFDRKHVLFSFEKEYLFLCSSVHERTRTATGKIQTVKKREICVDNARNRTMLSVCVLLSWARVASHFSPVSRGTHSNADLRGKGLLVCLRLYCDYNPPHPFFS